MHTTHILQTRKPSSMQKFMKRCDDFMVKRVWCAAVQLMKKDRVNHVIHMNKKDRHVFSVETYSNDNAPCVSVCIQNSNLVEVSMYIDASTSPSKVYVYINRSCVCIVWTGGRQQETGNIHTTITTTEATKSAYKSTIYGGTHSAFYRSNALALAG